MNALGMPIPTSLFGTAQTATGTLTAILAGFRTLGPGTTVAELIGATTGLEMLGVADTFLASAYAGVVIGSLILASETSTVGSSTAVSVQSSVRNWSFSHRVQIPASMHVFLARNPEVMDANSPRRPSFGFRYRTRSAARKEIA